MPIKKDANLVLCSRCFFSLLCLLHVHLLLRLGGLGSEDVHREVAALLGAHWRRGVGLVVLGLPWLLPWTLCIDGGSCHLLILLLALFHWLCFSLHNWTISVTAP